MNRKKSIDQKSIFNGISILFLLTVLLSNACEDFKQPNESPDSIIIGDTTNMLITEYDTLIKADVGQEINLDLDINNNGSNDFRFTSELRDLSYNVNEPHATFLSLDNNCCIYGKYSVDTIYIYVNEVSSYNKDQTIAYITHYIDIACYRVRKDDPIFYIQPPTYYPRYLYSNKEISISSAFQPDTIDLNIWSEGFNFGNNVPIVRSGGPYYEDGIPVYYEVGYHNDCYAMPDDMEIYLGIKLTDIEGDRLGWIKFGLLQGYKLIIFETAIQR